MKLLIIGPAGSGKDTLCSFLQTHYQLNARSSSWHALSFVAPLLDSLGELKSPAQHHAERNEHRALWYEIIKFYNKDDPARLAKDILASHDIYNGMRSRDEFDASRKYFDSVIWVERGHTEPASSMELTRYDADIVIDNTGNLEALERRAGVLYSHLSEQFNETTYFDRNLRTISDELRPLDEGG